MTANGFKATLFPNRSLFASNFGVDMSWHGSRSNNQVSKEIMKKLFLLMSVIFSIGVSAQSIYQPLAPMPNGSGGFHGSINNFQNNPNNFQNSPLNFQNSPLNSGAQNGIYDANRNRSGYTTQSPSGVINIWDNNENRLGYVPGR